MSHAVITIMTISGKSSPTAAAYNTVILILTKLARGLSLALSVESTPFGVSAETLEAHLNP